MLLVDCPEEILALALSYLPTRKLGRIRSVCHTLCLAAELVLRERFRQVPWTLVIYFRHIDPTITHYPLLGYNRMTLDCILYLGYCSILIGSNWELDELGVHAQLVTGVGGRMVKAGLGWCPELPFALRWSLRDSLQIPNVPREKDDPGEIEFARVIVGNLDRLITDDNTTMSCLELCETWDRGNSQNVDEDQVLTFKKRKRGVERSDDELSPKRRRLFMTEYCYVGYSDSSSDDDDDDDYDW